MDAATLRAKAERLIEHYPGEHAERDARGGEHRHDIRRRLLRMAEELEARQAERPLAVLMSGADGRDRRAGS